MINKSSPVNQLSQEFINNHLTNWLTQNFTSKEAELVGNKIRDYLNRLNQKQFDHVFAVYGWPEIMDLAEMHKK